MKKYSNKTSKQEKKFEDALCEMVDSQFSPSSLKRVRKAMDNVKGNSNKMFWMICLIIGVPAGSTYAKGVKHLTKFFVRYMEDSLKNSPINKSI